MRAFPASPLIFALSLILALASAANAQIGEKQRLVVLPFEVNASEDVEYLRESLPTLLADELRKEGFEVVQRDEVEQIIFDREIEYLDISTARDLALLTKADTAVYGSFSQVGETISLDVRLVEAFGLKADKAVFVVKKGLINILPAVEELAGKIRQELLQKEQVAEIEVEGTKVLDKDVVLMRIQTRKGDVLDREKLDQDLRNLFELGYFEDVQIEVEDTAEGKRVIFRVVEKPRIVDIRVEGSDEVDEDDILEAMDTKEGSVLNLKVLSQDLQKVRQLYRSKGYYLAEVDYDVQGGDGGGSASLVIDVAEGEKLYVEGITIEGAEKLDEGDLKDELALSERGIFSIFTGSGVLQEEMLDRDAAALEAYYANRGFIDAKVSQPEVEFKEDGIYVTFKVEEGPRFKVGEINLRGDLIAPEKELLGVVKLDDKADEDEYFDRQRMRDDLLALEEYYGNYGYAFARADVDMDEDRENLVINLDYIVNKQQKVFIRRVLIEGNTKTRDNVIRRQIQLGDGDPYSGVKVSQSTRRLDNLDYFEAVDMETVPTGDPSQMDLKVKVAEKNTGFFSIGAGYSSRNRVFGTGTITERNLLGRGYTLSFSGSLGAVEEDYHLKFINPHIYDTKLSGSVDFGYQEEEQVDFTERSFGATVGVGYPIGQYTVLQSGYNIRDFELRNVDDDDAELLRQYKGNNLESKVAVAAIRDSRRGGFIPVQGTRNELKVNVAGGFLGGDSDYIKYEYEGDYFTQLIGDTVLHLRGSAGLTAKNFTDDPVPPWARYFLGGIDTVRGYGGGLIGPRDPSSDDLIGGTKMAFANVEYYVPVWEEQSLWAFAFFDAGNSWEHEESFFEDTKQRDGTSLPLGLYKGVGPGLKWNSPFGPLTVVWGYPLDKLEDNNDTGRFEFSMGGVF
ncbi:outer membrane protein assembly factor BamA [Desulfohalovibrio reitneri]|uniref:outer membrane protein assembly factor BamA n=1 Tax=Desulfohalovibrio reitneri TaxID=1307759 RepID=UPI0004A6DEF0|nr:outer membrane protein assembly factor BamA [Desulfohalovibrio reitneri]